MRNADRPSNTYLLSDSPEWDLIERKLPEWKLLVDLLPELERIGELTRLGNSNDGVHQLPIYGMSFGSRDPQAPVLGIFGGVHGLERIGTQVCLALLSSLAELWLWDDLIKEALQKIRIIAVPMINPFGIMKVQRSNPNGVDLMRNTPIEAVGETNFLLGGHRISPKLPWYRGVDGLEPENVAVIDFCRREFFNSKCAITLDFHSGFGMQDQIWFPFANSRAAFPHAAEMHALKEHFDRTYSNHFYRIEPQSHHYTTHGDLWDYAYEQHQAKNGGVYLPLSLEMGSWRWIKKNPWQLLSPLGAFNPLKPHRQKRILRRHLTLFDFLIRALVSPKTWAELPPEQKNKHRLRSEELWYGKN